MKKYGWKIGFLACLFGSTFLIHFLYDWFPSPITVFFAPVNESVFEHMKLISTAWLLMGSIDLWMSFRLHSFRQPSFLSMLLAAISGICFYLIGYTPFPSLSHSMFFILVLLALSFVVSFWVYQTVQSKKIPYGIWIGVIGWIFFLSGMTYLSYHPLHIPLFFDTEEERYGLTEYVI